MVVFINGILLDVFEEDLGHFLAVFVATYTGYL